jgi:hypothetical protein
MDALYHWLLALLLAYELDGVARREWRRLYVLRGTPEATARPCFIAPHRPLAAAIVGAACLALGRVA